MIRLFFSIDWRISSFWTSYSLSTAVAPASDLSAKSPAFADALESASFYNAELFWLCLLSMRVDLFSRMRCLDWMRLGWDWVPLNITLSLPPPPMAIDEWERMSWGWSWWWDILDWVKYEAEFVGLIVTSFDWSDSLKCSFRYWGRRLLVSFTGLSLEPVADGLISFLEYFSFIAMIG